MGKQRRLELAIGLAIAVVSLAAYANSLSGDFVFDDSYFIKENPLVRDVKNLRPIFTSAFWEASSHPSKTYYRPLVVLSYAVNHSIGGFDPFGYHLLNVLIHAVDALLVFGLARRVGCATPAAGLAGLLFALHPINTEAVAWISGRSDLLGSLFTLAALVLYLGACPPRRPGTRAAPVRRRRLGAALLAFLLALLSKESAAALLGVIALYEFALRRLGAGALIRLGAFGAVLAAYLAGRMAVLGGVQAGAVLFVANPLVEEGPFPRVLTAVVLFGKYLWLLLLPLRLAVDYSFDQVPVARVPWDLRVVASGLAAGALCWLLLWSRRRIPQVFFGIGIFLTAGAFAFGNAIVPFGALMGERYMYLPSAGFSLAVAVLAVRGVERLPVGRRAAAVGAVLVLLAALSARTAMRNRDWRDDMSLFRSAFEVNPSSAIANLGLAVEYYRAGQLDRARERYRGALEIHPEFGQAHLGLGNVALAEGDFEGALEHLSRAVALLPENDEVRQSLGAAYGALWRLDEALRETQAALRLNPNSSRVRNNLGNIHMLRGETERALARWREAAHLDPFNAEALYNLAVGSERIGEVERAREYYRRFLEVAPERLREVKERVRARLGEASP